jgi:glycosyltransferase involved in cell wall biosynthesis
MTDPLVSVVCLCFNHERFVEEAITSVLHQSYPNIEVIVVDDASTDGSRDIIEKLVSRYAKVKYFPLSQNVGNCRAFNCGLAQATGSFVIDFATDDVMLPDRIRKQVDLFSTLADDYGVVFSNADYVDEGGKIIRNHYDYLFSKGLLRKISQGDVYRQLLSTYFISSPTMMVRRNVFDALGGYDETLSYEDFDFWVRSSRKFRYAYLDEVTTRVRMTKRSMSRGWYVPGDKQLYSTYLVCKKALSLNRSEDDRNALAARLKYEVRQSVFSENRYEAELFYGLLRQVGHASPFYRLLMWINKLRLPLSPFRRWYHRIRYGA